MATSDAHRLHQLGELLAAFVARHACAAGGRAELPDRRDAARDFLAELERSGLEIQRATPAPPVNAKAFLHWFTVAEAAHPYRAALERSELWVEPLRSAVAAAIRREAAEAFTRGR